MDTRSPITTHVLDTASGRPAEGIGVVLERLDGESATELATGVTDGDGRVADLLAPRSLEAGTYRLTFAVGEWLRRSGRGGFWSHVPIVFEVDAPDEHYHVPLLLSPYGYSTYRGS